jgi:hypothetical protein
MLTLQNIVVSVELVKALGTLPNLTCLTYDVPYPHGLLALNPSFGTFVIDELYRHPRRAPSGLRSLAVQFQANDVDYLAFHIIYAMARASRGTLEVIEIDFNWCCGWMPVHKIFEEHYPSLRSLSLCHTNFAWTSLSQFHKVHSEQLRDMRVMFLGTQRPDRIGRSEQLYLHEIPGLGDLTASQYTGISWRIDLFAMNLCLDEDGNISAYQLALVYGRWEMLPYIVQRHRHLRVLNMWDGQVSLVPSGSMFHVGPSANDHMCYRRWLTL